MLVSSEIADFGRGNSLANAFCGLLSRRCNNLGHGSNNRRVGIARAATKGQTMVKKLAQGVFFGRTHGCRAVPGITLMESFYGPEVIIPPHEHAAAFFDYVLEGFCSEVVQGQPRQRGRATLAFHPAGEVHANRWLEGAGRCFHIEIGSTLLDRVRSYARTLDRPISFAAGQARWLALRLYDEFRHTDEISALVIEALTLELLAEGVRLGSCLADRKPPRWLHRIRDLLHEEFRHRLTLDDIAGSVGIHPAHLARVFRQVHDCTVGDYVRNLRIEYACHCLRISDESLAAIALAAGFSDQSHFSNTFKRRMGMSPSVFRKSAPAR
jgi:AraC family transcriptional regulator